MLDTIIITGLGIIVVIQNLYITKLDFKLDILDDLHKYHNELVRITEKYINKEIDIVEYNWDSFFYMNKYLYQLFYH